VSSAPTADDRLRPEAHDRLVELDESESLLEPFARPHRRPLPHARSRSQRSGKGFSARKSGGQPGHEGRTRELVAPERVDERSVHLPERCGRGHEFDYRCGSSTSAPTS
jgi:transposase